MYANMSPLRAQRVAITVAVIVFIIFVISAMHHDSTPIQTLKDLGYQASNFYSTSPRKPSFRNSISRLYDSVRHSITDESYTDAYGLSFNISDIVRPAWTESLGSDVLIVDIDTRAPNGENGIFARQKINWETLDAHQANGVLSATFMNHFMYSQIHGYDYKYYNAHHIEGHHDTWIKPYVLYELLHSYRFVVFIDADAIIQHMEVPLEWLFNRWGVTPTTSIAMPLDVTTSENGDDNHSCDSKGRLVLNTGFIVSQALPHTFEMLEAWKECTTEKRYPGCGAWKEQWSHEQRAFSEFIRYDYNPHGDNIVEIPCDDAMSFPGAIDLPLVTSDCTGQFFRHFTVTKEKVKPSTSNALVQPLAEMMQKAFAQDREELWIKEMTKEEVWIEEGRKKEGLLDTDELWGPELDE